MPLDASRRLFSVTSIVVSAFLGGPTAGFVLMAVNYARLGRRRAAVTTLVVGLAVTAGAVTAGFYLPEKFPAPALAVPLLVVVWVSAQSLQGDAVARHQAAGGPMASTGTAVIVGLCVLVVFIGLLVGGAFLLAPDLGTEVAFPPNDAVYYSGNATASDAQLLGSVLKEKGCFGTPQGTYVLLSKPGASFVVSFPVIDGIWDNLGDVFYYRSLAEVLAQKGLGFPLVVELLDGEHQVRKRFSVEKPSVSP
jgi:hypothetical protein